jgi:hypothetical protein
LTVRRPPDLGGRFIGWAVAWSGLALLAYGLVAAIIPNPVFGREIPPEPFAIAVWVLSAPLMGVIGATYAAPAATRPSIALPAIALPLAPAERGEEEERRTGSLGAVASFGTFLAIGCPVCNKIALVLLGTGGTMAVWAPLQPAVGGASVVLLALTAAWRLRLRRSASCVA